MAAGSAHVVQPGALASLHRVSELQLFSLFDIVLV